jgi:formate/nitrite transporter
MNLFTPAETVENFYHVGASKTRLPALKMLLLGILAGALIAFAAVVSNTAVFGIRNAGIAKLVGGLIFPFGLIMVILMGAELFTGNSLICISFLNKAATLRGMLKNWALVYLGNLLGAIFIALCCAFFGQFDIGDGALAVFTIKLAAEKCTIPFGKAVVFGVLCNVLVTIAVLMSLSARDLTGRAVGAYIPVCFFVACGFEHCVANMYYIPAGIFATFVPKYLALAEQAGLDLSHLTAGGFIGNLFSVTLGNIIGGAAVSYLVWYVHLYRRETKVR